MFSDTPLPPEEPTGQNPPDGAMIELADAPGIAWLLLRGRLLRWSPGGYTGARAADNALEVTVLTPASIVSVLRNGYGPVLHPSAQAFV